MGKRLYHYCLAVIIIIVSTYFVVAYKTRYYSSIGYVDVDLLITNIVQNIALKNLSNEMIEKETVKELSHLDQVIKQISVDHKLIILPKAAVIAGSRNITQEVQNLMEKKND